MKTTPKPAGQYPLVEEYMQDYIKTDQYLKSTNRPAQYARAKDYWITQHAAEAEKAGATEQDLTGKTKEVIAKTMDWLAQVPGVAELGPVGALAASGYGGTATVIFKR